MLYTPVPLERVYHNFREDDKQKAKPGAGEQQQAGDAEFKEVMLKHGRVVTRRDGDNYIVQKIYSTDMSDYLKEEYAPGKIVKGNPNNQ